MRYEQKFEKKVYNTATKGAGLASKLLKMASDNPAPFGGRVQIKILFQILVHGNEKFQKS